MTAPRPGSTDIRVLLVAYGCRPNSGSEYGLGWSWVTSLSGQGMEVEVLTAETNRPYIESVPIPPNARFHYVPNRSRMARHLHPLVRSTADYLVFCRAGSKVAESLSDTCDIAHHVSWTNVRLDSPAYSSGLPVVVGPVGGGQLFPWRFLPGLSLSDRVIEISRNLQVLATPYRPRIRQRLRATALVVTGNAETRDLVEKVGAKSVTSMCDPGFKPADNPHRPTSSASGPLQILWVGRLFPRKGISLAIDAIRQLDPATIHLTVAGDGQDRYLVESAIAEGLPITLRGWMELKELEELYRTSDLLLVTSLRESGGPQLAEALGYGLPACVLDHQGPAEFARHGWVERVGVTNPKSTTMRLAEALRGLAADRGQLVQYHQRALVEAEANSVSSRAHAARAWYEQILASPRSDA